MTSENLYKWLDKTMNASTVSNVAKKEDLEIICCKQYEDIWKYLIRNVRPKECVDKVKGNLVLLSNQSKIEKVGSNKCLKQSTKDDEMVEKLSKKLAALKEKHLKIKKNNELIQKNIQKMKTKQMDYGSQNTRLQASIMDSLVRGRSCDFQHKYLLDIHSDIDCLMQNINSHHQHFNKISSSGSAGHNFSLQTCMDDLVHGMREQEEAGRINKKQALKATLEEMAGNNTAVEVMRALMQTAYKHLRLISSKKDENSAQNLQNLMISSIKKAIQKKQEEVLSKVATVHKLRSERLSRNKLNSITNDETANSFHHEDTGDDGEVTAVVKNYTLKTIELRRLQKRVEGRKRVLEGLEREVEELRGVRLERVHQKQQIDKFIPLMEGKQALLESLMSQKLKVLQLQEAVVGSVKLLRVPEEELVKVAPDPSHHHLAILRVVNKRPVEVLDLTPREHEYPISGQTMRKLLSLYDHPEYMTTDLLLHDNSSEGSEQTTQQHHLLALFLRLRDCTDAVVKGGEDFVSMYQTLLQERIQLASTGLAYLPVLQQTLVDWWEQGGLMEGTSRKVDGLQVPQWMALWKAAVVKVKCRK